MRAPEERVSSGAAVYAPAGPGRRSRPGVKDSLRHTHSLVEDVEEEQV